MSDSDTSARDARGDARDDARDARGPWDIEHRVGYPSIQEVAPAPDGRRTVYVVREPLLRGDRSEFLSHLYLASGADADADGEAGGGQQLTFGDHRNTSPRWSPDGRHIAFLSTRGGQANVYCLRATGGEAWAFTAEAERGVQGLEWSPDGRSLAFCLGDLPDEARQAAGRRRDDARVWGSDRRYAHLYVVPFRIGPRTPPEPRRLTAGPFHVIGFDWLPDGERIAFSHRPLPEWDHWWETRLGLVATGPGGDAPAEVVDLGLTGDWSARPLASPDGRWVACHTSDREGKWALSGRVVLYPVPGATAAGDADGRAPRPLAETPNGKCDPFGWSAAGDAVYVLEQTGMTTQLWALPADGGPGRALTEGTLLKAAPAVAGAGDEAIACVGQDVDAPNAVYRVRVAGGTARRVAAPPLPDGWPEVAPAAEVLRWPAGDGGEIEGLLVYPLGHTPGTACPLVVEVHGGPPSAFARGYVLAPERTVDTAPLTARGYAVLRPNPRGSSGYGRAFRFANYRAWGEGDLDDVLAGVDWLVQRGVADPARLGIAGWSYGGYLTAAAIARTGRFKAACVGAGITNAISFNGTADIPAFIPDYLETEFWDDPERYRRHSPLLRAAAISTPTLILHGEEDERVPVGQGRELHNALRRRGVPVELVLYPRQGHAIAEPRLMMDARRRIVDWMVRWV